MQIKLTALGFISLFSFNFSFAIETTDHLKQEQEFMGILHGSDRYVEALDISEKICDASSEHCDQSYFLAKRIGPEAVTRILGRMKSRCDDDPSYCEELSFIYEDQKDYKLATAAALKYFEKQNKGIYPWFAYKYGIDKTKAFQLSLKGCRENNDRCEFYLRYMPDHPQHSEILKYAERGCLLEGPDTFGSTNCAIVGTYYYSKGLISKAIEIWSKQCPTNQSACLLIMGSGGQNSIDSMKAYQNYCKYKPIFDSSTIRETQREFCQDFLNQKQIPPNIQATSKKMLKDYLADQK